MQCLICSDAVKDDARLLPPKMRAAIIKELRRHELDYEGQCLVEELNGYKI